MTLRFAGSGFRRVLDRAREEKLLVALSFALPPLLWAAPVNAASVPSLVDWPTIAALAGLMVLSAGLEESGALDRGAFWLVQRLRTERTLASALVLLAAGLSAVVTNDVALFIVVPLVLGIARGRDIPVGRLVVFLALAVNAGSAVSPIGNPQNLFLWQVSGRGFFGFVRAMTPLCVGLMAILLLFVFVAFRATPITEASTSRTPAVADPRLLVVSLALYAPFLILVDTGAAVLAAASVLGIYLVRFRRVLVRVDWLLLLVFILMFADLGLLAALPVMTAVGDLVPRLPETTFTAGVVASQLMSNVPAAIFLEPFTDDWTRLAWGVSVGGFGFALGSLANLIALRLARTPGLWKEFHIWSVPMLAAAYFIGLALLSTGSG